MQQNQRANPHASFALTALIGWALTEWPPGYDTDPILRIVWWVGLVIVCVGALKLIPALWRWLAGLRTYIRAVRKSTAQGSADWLSPKEARKAGLHKKRPGSRFAGVIGMTPLWLWTETHHLILGPAGTSKTSAAILPFLCSLAESCLVNDTKGELYETTAKFRAKKLGHRIVKLDPTDETSAQINPLDFIFELVMQNLPETLTLLRGMVLQLYPEPAQEGPNKFFRDGTRRAIAAVVMAVTVVCPPAQRTLATVYRAFSNADFLHDLLMEASGSELLNGEVADMVEDLHRMAFGDEGSARTYEQFRIGALQALDPFGPGNYLARITATTTFSFTELKQGKVTCYLIVDHNNKDTLGKWSGLMQWLAAYQLVRERSNVPVIFMLDEFCNAPLHALPSILTLLRSYGVKCILATQDLDDITRVYGKHALETVLSETSIKQFLGGIRSKTTLEYLSKYLGNYTEYAPNFSFDAGGVKESQGRTGRPLMTPDELRRLRDDLQIVIYKNFKPILAKKIQVFAVAPYRRQIGSNSMYGGKRHLLPVAVRVRRWRPTEVTRHGHFKRKHRTAFWLIAGYVFRSLLPTAGLVLAGCLAAMVFLQGFPHLRVEYAQHSSNATSYEWCRYWGMDSFTRGPGACPVILFRKLW